MYFALLVFILLVYHVLSDGDFSFLLTLGSICGMFGQVIIAFKMLSQRSAHGVSVKTMQLYAAVHFFRCCSILIYDGYLPFDRSGDWLYQAVEVASCITCAACAVLVLFVFNSTYDRKYDAFGNLAPVPHSAGALWLLVPCALVASIAHPSLNNNWFTDVAWTLAMYLEAVAILPQLFMFQKKGGEVEAFTSHYVFLLGAARFLHFMFWVSSYHELNDRYVDNPFHGGWFVGYIVLASQIVQLILMADYFYYYIKSVRQGGPMLLPSANV